MAQLPDALAVDDAEMKLNDNAAMYFVADGFDPKVKGINGRRVAGDSFIRGFFRHAKVDELVCLAAGAGDRELFDRIATGVRPDMKRRHIHRQATEALSSVGTLFYPSPNFANETWLRNAHGPAAWSICGVTHTISTSGVMQGFLDLRMADQREWDAVICTSRAVQSAVLRQFDMIDDHIHSRFRANAPLRPQIPIIPLGVHTDDFRPDAAAGQAMRDRIGAAKGDVVFTTIARLDPAEKFDPLPLFIALEQAASRVASGQKLHLALCGIYSNPGAKAVFEAGAQKLMPGVSHHLLDGADAAMRAGVLSGADVYIFPIDNVQETFGLGPIEAMAAGLPLIVSDWDGLRDTVSDDVGIRIPTRTLGAEQSVTEARRMLNRIDNHAQYCGLLSGMTQIDVAAMVDAVVALAGNPDLRQRMGQAGMARAQALYDWAQIIPQMQMLWSELARRRAATSPVPLTFNPVAPPAFHIFDAYPTQQGGMGRLRYVASPGGADAGQVYDIRRLSTILRFTTMREDVVDAQARIVAAGENGIDLKELSSAMGKQHRVMERVLIWLMKYDLIRAKT